MLYIVRQVPKGRHKAHCWTTVQVIEAASKKEAIAAVLKASPNDFNEHPRTLDTFCKLAAEPLSHGYTYRF